jgi:ketosteroid isomerase-like protein
VSEIVKAQIVDVEEQLRQAMLASDVSALDKLLAPKIIITSHLGELLSKQDDLAAHASGLIKIHELTPSEQHIKVHGEVAIASVRMKISGDYDSSPANGDFRFTRVWARTPDSWHIIAAHIGLVA